MSEEEIIEKFRNAKQQNYQEVIRKLKHDNITDIAITRKEYIDKLLKLIDKLQKANKYLQERLEFRVRYCNELEHELYEEGNYIHKEVIRKKIKELKEESNGDDYTLINVINILKNLLGE